ncbi:MAG TPA: HAMP domain-containing sensor histidine kinase, partial [Ktedonobacterales bacterium]|nr:HAMP domain-containing sensor histidine kinase [Ktedonobacterales bacterium]
VNDLLDTSRIQAGKLELRVEFADLACLLREVVEEQSQANPGRAIRMHLPATQQALIFADADRIGQVITNYLTNALKYSVAEGPVEVGLEVEEGTARVWVRDEGPGLSAEEQEHIWERFHRVPGIEVQSGSGIGLGLGLYISRAIIEQHHGQVGVQSTRGAGSTFWFTVPLATPEPAQEGSQADAPEGEPRAGGRRS